MKVKKGLDEKFGVDLMIRKGLVRTLRKMKSAADDFKGNEQYLQNISFIEELIDSYSVRMNWVSRFAWGIKASNALYVFNMEEYRKSLAYSHRHGV